MIVDSVRNILSNCYRLKVFIWGRKVKNLRLYYWFGWTKVGATVIL